MDPAYHARLLEAATAIPDTWLPVRVPFTRSDLGRADGAIIEIQLHPAAAEGDAYFTGEIRILGPERPPQP